MNIVELFGMEERDLPRVIVKNDNLRKELPGNEAERLILVDGAITTWERFGEFRDSVCHLADDGRILRYGNVIGTKDDIEIVSPSPKQRTVVR